MGTERTVCMRYQRESSLRERVPKRLYVFCGEQGSLCPTQQSQQQKHKSKNFVHALNGDVVESREQRESREWWEFTNAITLCGESPMHPYSCLEAERWVPLVALLFVVVSQQTLRFY